MFTCPMDPEIIQEGPGSCPICGMALEPETVTAENNFSTFSLNVSDVSFKTSLASLQANKLPAPEGVRS